jgi:hypothetical protein
VVSTTVPDGSVDEHASNELREAAEQARRSERIGVVPFAEL